MNVEAKISISFTCTCNPEKVLLKSFFRQPQSKEKPLFSQVYWFKMQTSLHLCRNSKKKKSHLYICNTSSKVAYLYRLWPVQAYLGISADLVLGVFCFVFVAFFLLITVLSCNSSELCCNLSWEGPDPQPRYCAINEMDHQKINRIRHIKCFFPRHSSISWFFFVNCWLLLLQGS